jgi:hypothetical protein
MKCPNCGSESSGAFCAECGAPLKGAKCRECAAPLAPGANFCTSCGTPTGAGGKTAATSHAPWYFAGGALVLLVLVLMWPAISKHGDDENAGKVPITQMQGVGAQGDEAAPPAGVAPQGPLTGTPREQADRLFNRIMTEKENGDTAKAKFFLPMGIQAYEMSGDLDADGRYHLSLLQILSGDYTAARATAESVLKTQPDHLLALSSAANAARLSGDNAAAKKYYQHFLAVYDSEMKTGKEEYQDHARALPDLKNDALKYSK